MCSSLLLIGAAKLMPPRTPKLKMADLYPRSCTNLSLHQSTCSYIVVGITYPDISDRSWNQSLKRSHAESLNNSGSNQRAKALGSSRPEAGNHQPKSGDQIHWPLSILYCQSIPDQTAEGNRNDDTSLNTLNEGGKGDVEFCCELDKSRAQKWANG
jgi:hypothetical protein